MRRWLLFLLLAVFPIQLIWAAAAPYCADAAAAAAAHHADHHPHLQGAADAAAPAGGDASPDAQAAPADDMGCHFVTPAPIPAALHLMAATPPGPPRDGPQPAYCSHVPAVSGYPDRSSL